MWEEHANDPFGTSDHPHYCFLFWLLLDMLLNMCFLFFLIAWRAARVGAGVPVSLERQPTTEAPKTLHSKGDARTLVAVEVAASY